LKIGCSRVSAGLVAASFALTRLLSVRAAGGGSDDSVATAVCRSRSSGRQTGRWHRHRSECGRCAHEHVALGPRRDADCEDLAAIDRGLHLAQRLGAHRLRGPRRSHQGLHDAAAQLAQVVVDDRDRLCRICVR
jgi:hypothetical protein